MISDVYYRSIRWLDALYHHMWEAHSRRRKPPWVCNEWERLNSN